MYEERATGLILPDGVKTSRALRQEAAERAVISVINSGYSHYGASRTKANVRGWNSYSGSAKEDIEDNLDLLRQRSRDAYMGIPSATAALKTLRTNVIAGGLMPSPQIDGDFLKMTSGQVEELQEQILREFSLWADSTACDADRVDDFYGLQQLAFLSSLMNGDAFATLTLKPRPQQPYDLRVRLIEADRVCSPNYRDRMTRGKVLGRDVESIVQGVETDEDGEIIAYWIANKHPRSYTTLKTQDWKRVEVYGKKNRNEEHPPHHAAGEGWTAAGGSDSGPGAGDAETAGAVRRCRDDGGAAGRDLHRVCEEGQHYRRRAVWTDDAGGAAKTHDRRRGAGP